jgi:hypothetical protein
LALANGGIPPAILAERFPNEEESSALTSRFAPRDDADEILKLFDEIYTLDVQDNFLLYRWSIACGLVNGFSHKCDRSSAVEVTDGLTRWTGRSPFGGIAYPSIRTDRQSLNYAFNDHGRSQLKIDHVQWVRRFDDGSFIGLDFANEWDDKGLIRWQNRPGELSVEGRRESEGDQDRRNCMAIRDRRRQHSLVCLKKKPPPRFKGQSMGKRPHSPT